jgi:Domain of unknown function (DUF5060)/Putative collagen-binding domain of a collagenase
MKQIALIVVPAVLAVLAAVDPPAPASAVVSGDLRQWHKVTLTLDGPQADETAEAPNPFVDYRLTVTFAHESGDPILHVPGYFAADGNAANSSATRGNKWRAHFSPDKTGRWDWRVAFVSGTGVAVDAAAVAGATPVASVDGLRGSIQIAPSNKTGVDFRARGRLRYVGARYLRFAGTGEYFLKAGTDAPETLLAYADFDGTRTRKAAGSRAFVGTDGLHHYEPHVKDWRPGDPTWRDGKGKGLIGALNYLASKGMNVISFLPYNAGGDGDNVWPFVDRDDKFHYDVSKLDQWQIVFDHAQQKGLYLHFKLQETENDDHTRGSGEGRKGAGVREALDAGDLGPERKLYLRELIARYGYLLALNWNLGEENTQTPDQQRAMAGFIRNTDPAGHHIVVHTFPNEQERVYAPLLGEQSVLTGASLQNAYDATHARTVRWVVASERAGRPWVVANDEQGSAGLGVPPDPGFAGWKGVDAQGKPVQTLHDIRKYTLWGNLMAGGAGVEYYFGYAPPHSDLDLEDFRSRDKTWDYARIALEFFRAHKIPFWDMQPADALVGNTAHDNSRYCLARAGDLYLVYLPRGGSADLDLTGVTGTFAVSWFDPRSGGALKRGAVTAVKAGAAAALGAPPDAPGEDWLVVVRRSGQ